MNTLVKLLQKHMFHAKNSFEPDREPACTEIPGGVILQNDVAYGATYPNSFLDLYHRKEGAKATVVYIHGGGYTWGDKNGGDPNGVHENLVDYFQSFTDAGYDVVSVNYALAPEYRYPVPLLQLSEALEFLNEHGKEYEIRTDRLVFCGGSAGSQLEGQFVNLQLNEALSERMKILPVLKREQIRAVLFNSSLLDCARFKEVDSFVYSVLFDKCGAAYFGNKKYAKEERMTETSVMAYMTADWPPVFITDGNKATFTEQAKELAARAEELAVPYTLNLYDRGSAVLAHGYETGNTEQAADNRKKQLAFLGKYIG